MADFTPVAVPDPDATAWLLRSADPCFGRGYRGTEDECRRCTAPVVQDGCVRLLNEVCRELTEDRPGLDRLANNLGSREVQRRLTAGRTVEEILEEIAGTDADARVCALARDQLRKRLRYLSGKGIPVPDLPDG